MTNFTRLTLNARASSRNATVCICIPWFYQTWPIYSFFFFFYIIWWKKILVTFNSHPKQIIRRHSCLNGYLDIRALWKCRIVVGKWTEVSPRWPTSTMTHDKINKRYPMRNVIFSSTPWTKKFSSNRTIREKVPFSSSVCVCVSVVRVLWTNA